MWHKILVEWLSRDEVDLGEVAEWYSWWRGGVLKELAEVTSVKAEFDKGMRVMAKAVAGA
jgi:tuftelin-interacting protein 11